MLPFLYLIALTPEAEVGGHKKGTDTNGANGRGVKPVAVAADAHPHISETVTSNQVGGGSATNNFSFRFDGVGRLGDVTLVPNSRAHGSSGTTTIVTPPPALPPPAVPPPPPPVNLVPPALPPAPPTTGGGGGGPGAAPAPSASSDMKSFDVRYHLQSAAGASAIAPNGEPLCLTGMRTSNVNSLDQNESMKMFRLNAIIRAGGSVDVGATAPEIPDSGLTADLAISYLKTPMYSKVKIPEHMAGNDAINLAYYHYMRLSRPDYLDLGTIINQCQTTYPDLKIMEADIRELPFIAGNAQALARLDVWKTERLAELKALGGVYTGLTDPDIINRPEFFQPRCIAYCVDTAAMRADHYQKYLSLLNGPGGAVRVNPVTMLPEGASFSLFREIVAVEEFATAPALSVAAQRAMTLLRDQGLESTIRKVAVKFHYLDLAMTNPQGMSLAECVRFRELFADISPGGMDRALLQVGEPAMARARINVEKRMLVLARSSTEVTREDREKYNLPDNRMPWKYRPGITGALALLGGPALSTCLIIGFTALGTAVGMPGLGLGVGIFVGAYALRKVFDMYCKSVVNNVKKRIQDPLSAAKLDGTTFRAAAVIETLLEDIQNRGWVRRIGANRDLLYRRQPATVPPVGTPEHAAYTQNLANLGRVGPTFLDPAGTLEPRADRLAVDLAPGRRTPAALVEDRRYAGVLERLMNEEERQRARAELLSPAGAIAPNTPITEQMYNGSLLYNNIDRGDRLGTYSNLINTQKLTADEVMYDHVNGRDIGGGVRVHNLGGVLGVNRFSGYLSASMFLASKERRNDTFQGSWCEAFPSWIPFIGGDREPTKNMDFVARQLNLARADIEYVAFNYHVGFTAEERKAQDSKAVARMEEAVVKDIVERYYLLEHKWLSRFQSILGLNPGKPGEPGPIGKFFGKIFDMIPDSIPG